MTDELLAAVFLLACKKGKSDLDCNEYESMP